MLHCIFAPLEHYRRYGMYVYGKFGVVHTHPVAVNVRVDEGAGEQTKKVGPVSGVHILVVVFYPTISIHKQLMRIVMKLHALAGRLCVGGQLERRPESESGQAGLVLALLDSSATITAARCPVQFLGVGHKQGSLYVRR